MNKQQLRDLATKLNEDEDVEDARVVEFMGKPHVHIDTTDGDIETVTQDGTIHVVPIWGSTKNS
jgi:hypothetical protein